MQKPVHIFLFLVALGLVITGLSFLSPKEKVKVGEFELGFYQPQDLLGPLWTPSEAVLEDTVAWAVDSLDLDTLPAEVVEVVKEMPVLDTTLQMGQWDALAPFFEALGSLERGERNTVRIIHYGDSQLEGDRITMQLRNSLQKNYGGRGFGYVALEPLVEPASLDFVNAEGFVRKTAFGRRDTAIKDMAYGHLASFTMLAPNATGTGYAGQVTFSKRNWGYTLARDFTRVRLSLRTTAFVIAQIYVADTVFSRALSRSFMKEPWPLIFRRMASLPWPCNPMRVQESLGSVSRVLLECMWTMWPCAVPRGWSLAS